MNKVKVIALFGKAGSGKDTILRALVKVDLSTVLANM